MIGIWYDDSFGLSDLDRIMFWAKFSDQDQIRILLKFFGAVRIIKFQYPHNTEMYVVRHLKALVFLFHAFEESVDCHLLLAFCDDSNLHISLFKYVLFAMGVSKESISKILIGNRFHVKLRILILSPENYKQSLRMKSWKAEVTTEKKQTQDCNQKFRNTSS